MVVSGNSATRTCNHALLRLHMRRFHRLAPTGCRRVDLCHGLRARLRPLLSKLPGRSGEGTWRFAACSPHATDFAVSGRQVQDSGLLNALSHARPKVCYINLHGMFAFLSGRKLGPAAR